MPRSDPSPAAFSRTGLARAARAALAVAALGVLAAGARAQPYDGVPGYDRPSHGARHGDRDGRDGRRHELHDGRQAGPRHGPPPQAYHPNPHAGPGHRPGPPQHARAHGHRGAGPHHDWYQGGRIPPMYRSRHYVVNDWRRHHLAPPPRGYHWVQNGPDYLLITIGSGVIAQIVFR
ncbi:RcnB family protein [Paracidovorax anthurii]|uniref:Nickel/cobalt transporter regulator n=1 Tax=Paracidovorax anthurii TaxID=78229 RepID=A0A328ZHV2_9BURK|nr:RcnB family protein [Paracidovorax anthurii]RAR85860.1 nickel/cobalt transporter regulator [Paracidovorax anthurii]